MDVDSLVRLRPFVFHLTAATNAPRIARAHQLDATSRLFTQARRGRDAALRARRPAALALAIDDETVRIRDQKPLHERHIAFEKGWDMPRLVGLLNDLVFFWPGTERGPIKPGQGHFALYEKQGEELVILRVPTAALLAANEPRTPLVSRCNSGAPSRFQAPGAPRGGSTFLPLAEAPFAPSNAVELVFEGHARLPDETLIGPTPQGPWRALGASERAAGRRRAAR